MDFLLIETPDGLSYRYDLGETTLRLGRARINDLRLEDAHISRLHAEIFKGSDGYYIRDVGGKSGTFVNDKPVTESQRLRPGDCIRLGKTRAIFNATAISSVEFSDLPLPDHVQTTAISVDSIPSTPPFHVLDSLGVSEPPGTHPASVPPTDDDIGLTSLGGLDTLPSNLFRAILEADRELVFNRPPDEILGQIMNLVRKSVRFERGVLMVRKSGDLVPEVVRVYSDHPLEGPIRISRTISNRVLSRLEAILTTDALHDDRFRDGDSIQSQHVRSAMCVPLWNHEEVIGLIYVDSPTLTGQFTKKDLLVLTHFAYIVSGKIEQQKLFDRAVAARTMEKDLQLAVEIQRSLLPETPPVLSGYGLHGISLPCSEVGGDYFDFERIGDGRLAISLGDVTGHGLPAAMLMCCFQATLRTLISLDLPPDVTMSRLNQLLCPHFPDNRFVTFFFGILDTGRHQLTWVNAAHNPPFLISADGSVTTLPSSSGAIGTFDHLQFSAQTVPIRPGDLLFCYSDGATEASNPEEEDFGTERLLELVRGIRNEPPARIGRRVQNEIEQFLTGMAPNDDLTMVVLKRDLTEA